MVMDAATARELGEIKARLVGIDERAQERAAEIKALSTKVDRLLEVFTQGKGMMRLVAWLFAAATAVGGWSIWGRH